MPENAVGISFPIIPTGSMLMDREDCGNTINGGNGPAPEGLSGCSMTCSGNSTEFCGGPYRLDMYQAPGTGATPISMTSFLSFVWRSHLRKFHLPRLFFKKLCHSISYHKSLKSTSSISWISIKLSSAFSSTNILLTASY